MPAASSPSLAVVAGKMREMFEDGEPAVVRGLQGLFGTEEVFEWIRHAHPGGRGRRSRDKIRALKTVWHLTAPEPQDPSVPNPGRSAELFRGGGMVLDADPYLPRPEHSGFEAWVAQTNTALGGPFGMQAPGIECASWDALDRLQLLLAPTLRMTGPRTYRFNAFAGDAPRTPFGFHLDTHHEAVFQYVVHGMKRACFWEGLTLSEDDRYWIEETNGLADPPKAPDVAFDLEPGDLVFWPGTHVHGFETDGPTLGLSMVVDRTSPRDRNAIIDGLEVRTAGGRAALPPLVTGREVTREETVRRRSVYPVEYERYDDELIIGICGRTFEWTDRLSLTTAMRLFDFMNEHPEVGVSEVIEACADEWLEPDEVLGALSVLRTFGFLA